MLPLQLKKTVQKPTSVVGTFDAQDKDECIYISWDGNEPTLTGKKSVPSFKIPQQMMKVIMNDQPQLNKSNHPSIRTL